MVVPAPRRWLRNPARLGPVRLGPVLVGRVRLGPVLVGPVLVGLVLVLSSCSVTIHIGASGTTSTTGHTAPTTTVPAYAPTSPASPFSSVGPTGAPSTTGNDGTLANGIPAALVGDWLGPFPSSSGKCNSGDAARTEYGEWWFYSAGSYTFASNSEPLGTVAPPAGSTSTSTTPITTPGCGVGMTLYGKYSVQGDVITLYQQGDPGCPTCTQTDTVSFGFSLIGHQALKLCDNTVGECWTYYRQSH